MTASDDRAGDALLWASAGYRLYDLGGGQFALAGLDADGREDGRVEFGARAACIIAGLCVAAEGGQGSPLAEVRLAFAEEARLLAAQGGVDDGAPMHDGLEALGAMDPGWALSALGGGSLDRAPSPRFQNAP